MELINGYGRIFNQEVRDAMFTIYWNGNQSAHSDTITGKKEANDSFRSLQIFLLVFFLVKAIKIFGMVWMIFLVMIMLPNYKN